MVYDRQAALHRKLIARVDPGESDPGAAALIAKARAKNAPKAAPATVPPPAPEAAPVDETPAPKSSKRAR